MIRQGKGLTATEVDFFEREGYLVVEDLLGDGDLQAVIDEIGEEVDGRAARLVEEGGLSRGYGEWGFSQRLTWITRETDQVIRGISSGALAGPAFFGLITHPKLLDVAESLCGGELIASSAYRLRPKLPAYSGGEVPWHQDSGYFDPYCDEDLIVTVWLPLVDADEENGCLHLMPRVHRGGVLRHRNNEAGTYLVIAPEEIQGQGESIAVPVRKGSVLLLTNRTPHASFANRTQKIRWSMDIRYQSAHLPTNALLAHPMAERGSSVPPACYPPSADFVVRSARWPDQVIRSAEDFARLRRDHKFELDAELAARVQSGRRHVSVNPFSLVRWSDDSV